MATTMHSFMDIFDSYFGEGDERVQLKKIVIPIIQRDYAQGRIDPDVDRVRRRFLDSLYQAITNKPITLDFVYGDLDADGIMTPLDGQQRLTTLFLIHWYAAKKEGLPQEEWQFLHQFSYETRYSARYFCTELVEFEPTFDGILSEEIINQAWFPLDWKKDPTIRSMLVMLDAIDDKFCEVEGLWECLKEGAITFYFLPVRDMGLTDELYIKMNSRGKPLTLFEHFKAELEHEVRSVDPETADRIAMKIDQEWTDLLWRYRDSGNGEPEDDVIDDEFLRYFKFICDIICYKQGDSPSGRSDDEFDLLEQYFSADTPELLQNVELMERFFDCWCEIPGFQDPSAFLQAFMSTEHEEGKILIEKRFEIDIFEDCLHAYADKTGRVREFPLNRIVLLYAIVCYLQHSSEVSLEQFGRRIRIVNNLIQNSEDEVSDRSDRNRIPAILEEIDAIILTGQIDESIDVNFNKNQLQEEQEKMEFLNIHPEQSDLVYRLEDHDMLRGQIGILGLEHLDMVVRFESLFQCDWDKIDCAMMAIGDYGQMERNKWRYQYASSEMLYAWQELFHRSSNSGFENTKEVLITLLSSYEEFSNEVLQEITDAYVKECEESKNFTFRYYYLKYDITRPGRFGKVSKEVAEPYVVVVMWTRMNWSENAYIPYLKAADEAHLSRDDMGQRLIYGEQHIVCTNDSYLLRNENEDVLETIPIPQNEEGVDTVDRVVLLKDYLKRRF